MGDKTGIEWADATWNPLTGCTRVSKGCDNCYAAKQAAGRLKNTAAYRDLAVITPSGRAAFNGRIRLLPERINQPLRWRHPRRIFVNSMSDLFHPDVPDEFIAQVWQTMRFAKQHIFQILTKRPERMAAWLNRCANGGELGWITHDGTEPARAYNGTGIVVGEANRWPLPNVWLGTSVEDQATADERIPHLLRTPAAVRFLSCEPLLGPLDIREHLAPPMRVSRPRDANGRPPAEPFTQEDVTALNQIGRAAVRMHGGAFVDWIIVGGESGPHARPMHPEWARDIERQCRDAGVPFLFKQWGEWAPLAPVYEEDDSDRVEEICRVESHRHPVILDQGGHRWDEETMGAPFQPPDGSWYLGRVGKKNAGRELYPGRTFDQFPEVADAR